MEYRAWGGLKKLQYGNGTTMTMDYNDRLRPSDYKYKKDSISGSIIEKEYSYNADGTLHSADDKTNGIFDRLNIYDHMGRIKEAKTGAEANGGTAAPEDQEMQLPYRQTYNFNEYNNLNERLNRHWGRTTTPAGYPMSTTYAYHNNRIVNTGWQHDADGRVTAANEPGSNSISEYDAKGQLTKQRSSAPFVNSENIMLRHYDGNGREVKRAGEDYVEIETSPYFEWQTRPNKYFIRSSVLGNETINEVDATGKRVEAYIFAAGTKIATHRQGNGTTTNSSVSFHQSDASALTGRSTHTDGTVLYARGYDDGPYELDPTGNNMDSFSPYFELSGPELPPEGLPLLPLTPLESPMYVNGQALTCEMDGVAMACGQALSMIGNSAQPVSNDIGTMRILSQLGFSGQWLTHSVDFVSPDGTLGVGTYTTYNVHINPYGFGGHWNIPLLPTANEPGIFDIKKTQLAKFDEDKMKECAKSLFGVETTAFEIGMSFNGTQNYYDNIFFGSILWFLESLVGMDRNNVSVKTEKVTSREIQGKQDTFGLRTGASPPFGYTDPNGLTSYVAKDLGSASFVESAWVYELGNALGIQSGNHPKAVDEENRYQNKGSRDVGGPAMMDCVYGGKVNLNGTVSPVPAPASN